MRIDSPKNPRIKALARLHDPKGRRETGHTLLEGPHLLEVALDAGARIAAVYALAADADAARLAAAAGADLVEVSQPVLRKLAGTEHPRGPVAEVAIPRSVPPESGDVLVLWAVADPGNVGTLIRSAAAFGFAVAAGPGTADPWSPKAIRAGAGGHFTTPVSSIDDLDAVRRNARRLVASVVHGGRRPAEVLAEPSPVAIVVGSEAHGLPDTVTAAADDLATIPMRRRTESLNAAVAGSILMYARDEARVVDTQGPTDTLPA